ncbi:mitochondrial 39-S ribosomal protein L47 (MRP-L47)-domain-containing protein [Cokeromyces recurvatus]|uniref:mitochondrial 39-S ribosomal protein L47 (MRP-L47)-domain-containing protein n=1 Tax=Cokeromyces recurvatus TaxID=90255 RepID=UPI002220FE65|nr:mitochondrial 39-S ribosomal protein L47 (MRP-L47)-domain-containing protein [Cokeromyces recurvatus]KAI7907126.1 mitochondrial 39-S ribosomal protein L47 (MRP-L47)-domain-containing protein [Cokeromyces recurvatus]
MSYLQRITRTFSWNTFNRKFSTSRIALSTESTNIENTAKPKGLYQFFENNEALPKQIWTGRAWKTQELRQKSFEDLHKLWYVLLKERNVLATQKEEARRLRVLKQIWTNQGRMKKCQKSMARIKCVLYERQREYEKQLMSKAAQ